MNSLLELHNIYYSYHTLDAETRALSDLSFSRATWNLHSSCRSFRMRQIYTSLPDLWIDEAKCRRNPVKWYPSQGKFFP